MKKFSWTLLFACLATLVLLMAYPLSVRSAADVATATHTRWPTITFSPTATRWPSMTPSLTPSRWPSLTSSLTSTLWPTHATATRWPTITPSRTATRWPTAVTLPTGTHWPTAVTQPTGTHWPTATFTKTSTRWPSATVVPTNTRWPTAARSVTKTPTLNPSRPSSTFTPTKTRTSTVTIKPSSTRWPTVATSTRWPTVPTSTRWPTLATSTRWPTAATSTRWPTVAASLTATRWPSATRTPTATPTSTQASWLLYINNIYGFQFNFPSDANITAQQDNFVQIYMSITPGTNLVEKYLEVYATQNDSTCGSHYGGTSAGTVVINGHSFNLQTGMDAGAGQIREWSAYSTIQDNLCVSFNFILHSGNIGAYPAGTPTFNKSAESAIFTQILNTFVWLPRTQTPIPSDTPTLTPTATPLTGLSMGPFGVVKILSNDVLNIRSGAGASYSLIGSFPYYASNVMRSGPVQAVSGVNWYQIQLPAGGTGWASSLYLTESIPSSIFCGDARVQPLFSQLQAAINTSNGTLFASLISPPRGVDIRYWHSGNTINYTAAQAAFVFSSSTAQNWGSGPSAADTVGTFSAVVQPALQEVLNAPYESYCDNPKTASSLGIPWPYEYTNFNYYSLLKPGTPGVDVDYKQWMVGIDYVDGRPYIATLIRVIWEP